MGNLISSTEASTALKTAYDAGKVVNDTALNLANGDTVVKQKLTVTGTSTFNDDITLATGKKINGIDVGTLNTNITTLQTNVSGMNAAVSGDFTGKSISGVSDMTASGAGTFGSVKTSNIDINGNITSTSGKSYITSDAAAGLKFTNGLPSTDAKHAFQTMDAATGNVTIFSKGRVTVGGEGVGRVTINGSNGEVSLRGVTLGVDGSIKNFLGGTILTPSLLQFGKTTVDSSSISAANITSVNNVFAKNLITSGGITNTGPITNTGDVVNSGALKLGTNKWLINEVVDTTKGTRLCFGSEDSTGRQVYWTCMNNQGNLEKF
jgi:hypothetical protein